MNGTGSTPRRSRRRALVLAAIAIAATLPAAAAALGVDLGNPVAVALRASGAKDGRAVDCAAPCADVAAAPARPSATPTRAHPATAGSGSARGDSVATVAACAPRGQDPLFARTGDLRTHGDFVAAAAAGHTLALPFGSYDLSTAEGAASLCAALEGQRAAMEPAPSERSRPATARPSQSPKQSPKPSAASASPRPDRERSPKASPREPRSAGSAESSPRPRPSRSR